MKTLKRSVKVEIQLDGENDLADLLATSIRSASELLQVNDPLEEFFTVRVDKATQGKHKEHQYSVTVTAATKR